MSSDPSNNKSNLPPWLHDVQLPPRPRDLAAPANQAQPAAEAPSPQLPAWLDETTAPPGQPVPSADLPDWLRGEPPAPAQTSGDQDTLPDWLRDSQTSQPSPPRQAEELPSWLRDITETPAQPEPPAAGSPPRPAGEAQLPDWLHDTQEAAPSALPEKLPDWLRDIAGLTADQGPESAGPPAPPAETRADASESVPAWLRDSEQPGPPAGTPTAPQPASHDEVDSSLQPFSFDEPSSTGPAAHEDSLPAWLGGADDSRDANVAMPGWLNDTASQPASPAPEAQSSDEPDWLKGLSEQAPAASEGASGQPDVPLWLQDIERSPAELNEPERPLAAPEEPAAPAEPAAGPRSPENLPSWLQDVDAGQADTGATPSRLQDTPTAAQPGAEQPPAPAPDAGTLPSWLQEAPGGPTAHEPSAGELPSWLQEATSAPAPEASAADLPSWLQETPAAAQPAPESTPSWPQGPPSEQPAQEPPTGDLPAWLQGTPAAQPTEVSADTSPAETADQDTLPEWLRPAAAPQTPPAGGAAQDIPPWLRDEAGQPLPTAGAAGDTSLPAWLRGAPIDQPQTGASNPAQAPSAPQPERAGFDWFEDEATPAVPQPAASAPANELVGGIELPAWLRPPEPEQPKELNPTDTRSLDWLTRLGGQEEEEGQATAIAPATKLRPPSTPARTQAQIEALGLLQRLAAEPYPEIEPIEAAPVPSIWRRFGVERLLYLLLLLALVVGLALPLSGTLGLNTPPTAPGAQDLFAQIDTLTPNDTVLVGYEWDARRSGELRPLEQAVLGHLIQRHVKLVLVSTDAQGTLLLFDLRDELGAAGYRPSGEDYILLGYKPGAELALRSLAQDFRGALRSDFQGNDATLSGLATDASGQPRLNSLADFAMVLVLADEPADVQGWMEQVRTNARKADGSYVPFGFVLPAETAPIVQPYLSQSGIYHLAGKQGALTYEQLRGQSDAGGQIAGEAGQQRLSLLIYVALFVAGAVIVGLSGAVARGRRRQ